MGKSLRKANRGFRNNRGRWDESFKDEQFQIPGRATKIRLFDEFDTIPHHWVEFYSKKAKGMKGFYALCLNYDYEEGESADNGCPYCEAGMRSTNYTYGLMISRKEQRSAGTIVRPIRLTPKCTSDILNLTESAYPDEEYPDEWEDEDGEGPDATHPVFGFDITIKVGQKNGKTEYSVSYADNGKCKLKKEELKAFKDAAEQLPFAQLALAGLETKKEAQDKLKQLGIGEDGASEDGNDNSKKSADYSDYDEDEVPEDEEGAEDEEETKPKPKAKKKASAKKQPAKKVAAIPDDDDEGDEDEDEEARGLPWDADEDDEDNEHSYADDDEDDAPDDDDEE